MANSDNLLHHLWESQLTRREVLRWGAGLGLAGAASALLGTVGATRGASVYGTVEAAPPASARYLVMLIIDAARADYLSYGRLPHIERMKRRGTYYERAWVGQMESITPASHASLGTGCFPKHDGGILGFWWEDPATNQNYTCAPLDASDPGRLERLIGASQAPTLAGILKAHDPKARMYTASGHKFYAADAVGGPDADMMNYFWTDSRGGWSPVSLPGHNIPTAIANDPGFRYPDWKTMQLGQQDALVGDLAMAVVRRELPRVVVLNLPEMDWPVAHMNGGPLDPTAVTTLMENADRALGRIMETYRDLGIIDQTVFAVLGDHGVIPVEHQVDPEPVNLAVKNAGTQIITSDFHTGGFLWLEDPSRAMKTSVFLDYANVPGVSGVYFLSDADARSQYLPSPETARRVPAALDAAYGYLLETINGPDAPHVVLVYDENTGTEGAGGGVTWKGDHGGASWGSQAVPLILQGPGVRSNNVPRFPARLVDVVPTVLRLLGAPYPRLDGVALADAFTRPTAGELTAQRAVGTELEPIVDALRAQSRSDVVGAARPPGSRATGGSGTRAPLVPSY